jgi:hypothetical protein
MFGDGIKYICRLCGWFMFDVSDRQQRRTSSSPWPPRVGSDRKKRRNWRRDRRHHVPRAPLYSPIWYAVSGTRPSDQPSMAKEASGKRPGAPLILIARLRAVAWWQPRNKGRVKRALTTSQLPAPLSTKCATHFAHASSWDLRGFDSPRAHRPPSMARIHTHQVLWFLVCQICSTWPIDPSPRQCGTA